MVAKSQANSQDDSNRRARWIVRRSEQLSKDILEPGATKDKAFKVEALVHLAYCSKRHWAIPPPIELVNFIGHLLGLANAPKTGQNSHANDLITDVYLRSRGHIMGFPNPQPATVAAIDGLLIPFEADYAWDPSGNRPSVATDTEVANHIGARKAQVKKWRMLQGVMDMVAHARAKNGS